MTTDDILKLIMAGTGSAAALYTISHPQTTTGRTVAVGTGPGGTMISNTAISPLVILGGMALLAFVLLER